MRDFNFMVSGFCAAAGMLNLMTGQYVMGGVVLFLAVINYKMAGKNEE